MRRYFSSTLCCEPPPQFRSGRSNTAIDKGNVNLKLCSSCEISRHRLYIPLRLLPHRQGPSCFMSSSFLARDLPFRKRRSYAADLHVEAVWHPRGEGALH